jgi:hypothetical protein
MKLGGVMRNAALFLLAIVSSSAVAEWVALDNADNLTAYADPATIRKTGDIVKMWTLFDYSKPFKAVAGLKPYISTRHQFEYDCKEERLRMLTASGHSKHMAEGEVVYISTDPKDWMPVPPGTINETLWKFACRKL